MSIRVDVITFNVSVRWSRGL